MDLLAEEVEDLVVAPGVDFRGVVAYRAGRADLVEKDRKLLEKKVAQEKMPAGRARVQKCRHLALEKPVIGDEDAAEIEVADHARQDGSRPTASASLSSWHSKAKRGCTEPCPRFGPQHGLLV